MSDQKTRPTGVAIEEFIASVPDERRREEARALDALFRRVTGFQPQMWGPSIIGYGSYAYRYDSGRTGEAPATGFSPRKADLSLYVIMAEAGHDDLLARLGKHRMGKACLYIKHLSDADPGVLEELIRAGLADLAAKWPVSPQ